MGSSRTRADAALVNAVRAAFSAVGGLRDETLTVGLSGGIDSIVLLHVARDLAADFGYRLRALHVHHGISAYADEWAAFCRRLCRQWQVPLRVRKVSVGPVRGLGREAAARHARHDAFRDDARGTIALAHHLDDQAETLLLRLLRGTGVRGAGAMRTCGTIAGHRVIRPMLSVPRSAIVRYARGHGLKWVDDDSNLDTTLARNYLRVQVAPLLDARFPRWRDAFARAARHFSARDDAQQQVLRAYLAEHGLRAPAEARLADMIRQLGGSGTRTLLRHDGAFLRVYRGTLTVERERAGPTGSMAPVRWQGERAIALQEIGGTLQMRPVRGRGIDRVRAERDGLLIRLARSGDRLQPDGRRPRRTMKNLFQESGLAPHLRGRIPAVCCGAQLAWVEGFGVDVSCMPHGRAHGILPVWVADPAT